MEGRYLLGLLNGVIVQREDATFATSRSGFESRWLHRGVVVQREETRLAVSERGFDSLRLHYAALRRYSVFFAACAALHASHRHL